MSHLSALISDDSSCHVSQDAVETTLFKVVAMGDCGLEPSQIDWFMEIMGDEDLIRTLREGSKYIQGRKGVPWERSRSELDLLGMRL